MYVIQDFQYIAMTIFSMSYRVDKDELIGVVGSPFLYENTFRIMSLFDFKWMAYDMRREGDC